VIAMTNNEPTAPVRQTVPLTPAPRGPGRALLVAAVVEAISLLILFGNLATAHHPALAAAVGPIHGTAYLVVILLTWTRGHSRRARLLAMVPGIGGLLVRYAD
jgi:hypothetical protein